MSLVKKSSIRFTGALLACLFLFSGALWAQKTSNHGNKFEQLGTVLPTPNQYRSMDGSPGPQYWQQRADYDINASLDTENQRLDGQETVTYYNQSPNTLRYLWLQLDENEHAKGADNHIFDPSSINNRMGMSGSQLELIAKGDNEDMAKFGHKIQAVTDENDEPLNYFINKTMMRVELPEPLKAGESFTFKVDWYYYLTDRMDPLQGGRGGYEYFEDQDEYIFTITQWYPRMCVYSDFEGWQNKQFTGRGEFALNFGNFVVKMDVPKDYVVGSTGECLNYGSLLTDTQKQRWEQAKTAEEPVKIVTLDEAKKNAKRKKTKDRQTWIYKADMVRDFAWTASRKFVWDAMPHYNEDGKRVMCMSYYPEESYPIYSKYSTKAVAHTLEVYSKYSIPYPYPVAISVEASNGMEYPMICFNYGRAEEDGTYTERAKYGAIGVIIHEVGHNYYPMIINSDERQWTWFDEGINTFVQFLAESEWDNDYPVRRGPAHLITDYMASDPNRLEPIMTNSENIVQFGNNAYAKPATGLNILRETIMGRELFDYAFKEYARRWAFKHPTPADFFRTMEDASGVDLDWFWRGWFYGIEPVDIKLDTVKWFQVDMENDPEPMERTFPQKREKPFRSISQIRNAEDTSIQFLTEEDPDVVDFYTNYKPWETEDSIQQVTITYFDETYKKKEKEEKFAGKNYYELTFVNEGGLPMPLIVEFTYEDGTKEIDRIPVEIWRKNENKVSKVFVKDKVATDIRLDPYRETADIDESDNSWPVNEIEEPSRFQVFKSQFSVEETMNPMQKAIKAGKLDKDGKVIKP
ncbi:MAG TPA: M1 family metallopeptidase [Saprospiraceae bacterium]|nr:M1 family metallopeptidase [Saprospiraceae bacterium]